MMTLDLARIHIQQLMREAEAERQAAPLRRRRGRQAFRRSR